VAVISALYSGNLGGPDTGSEELFVIDNAKVCGSSRFCTTVHNKENAVLPEFVLEC